MTTEASGVKTGVKREAASATTETTTETLVSIWQRVLRIPSVDIHDDFFDVGGDSSLALLLFAEIGQAFGRELPPVTIYQARTIAALAELIELPSALRFPALVLLREGAKTPPVFLAHGLGGSVMDFFQPVRHIQTEHAIYGLQAKGSDGLEEPLDRIEDMADFYLEAIREVQPHGPYALIGYSLGGLVALEMAQRLKAHGETIALLAMLDAYPHMRHLAFAQRGLLFARQLRRGLHSVGDLTSSAAYKPPTGVSLTPAMQRVRNAAYNALTAYRPRFYDGKIQFVRAADITAFPRNAGAVWKSLVREIEVETVPGDHLGIIATHYEELAEVLSRYLANTFAEPR
jgi:thioesterase domain-containing protein/acyl carrier protein